MSEAEQLAVVAETCSSIGASFPRNCSRRGVLTSPWWRGARVTFNEWPRNSAPNSR